MGSELSWYTQASPENHLRKLIALNKMIHKAHEVSEKCVFVSSVTMQMLFYIWDCCNDLFGWAPVRKQLKGWYWEAKKGNSFHTLLRKNWRPWLRSQATRAFWSLCNTLPFSFEANMFPLSSFSCQWFTDSSWIPENECRKCFLLILMDEGNSLHKLQTCQW